MSELLPCPFCGGEARMLVQMMFDAVFFGAKCDNCGAEAAAKNTEAEAIAAWNTRAERSRFPELIRCRDCAKADEANVHTWEGDTVRSLLCTRFKSFNHTTDPDGFCHEAERRRP